MENLSLEILREPSIETDRWSVAADTAEIANRGVPALS